MHVGDQAAESMAVALLSIFGYPPPARRARGCATLVAAFAYFLPIPSRWESLGVDNIWAMREVQTFPHKRKNSMPETKETTVGTIDPAQAADLCQLVNLEAHWENLRKAP